MLKFYNQNEWWIQLAAVAVGLTIAYFSLLQPIVAYTTAQKRLNKEKRFLNYHKLIDDFSEGKRLDRQIAIVFELRKLSEYHSVTRRILNDWLQNEKLDQRLRNEIQLTLVYIDTGWWRRRKIE